MKKLSALVGIALLSIGAMAEEGYEVYLNPDDILVNGDQVSVALEMDNATPITLIQADIVLPEGIDILADEDGMLQITSESRAENHIVAANKLSDGNVRFIIMSDKNGTISGSEGKVARINFDIDRTLVENYQIRLTNILLVEPSETCYRPADYVLDKSVEDAIASVRESGDDNGVYYNVAGQRVLKTDKGIIVKKGRKVVVKN